LTCIITKLKNEYSRAISISTWIAFSSLFRTGCKGILC